MQAADLEAEEEEVPRRQSVVQEMEAHESFAERFTSAISQRRRSLGNTRVRACRLRAPYSATEHTVARTLCGVELIFSHIGNFRHFDPTCFRMAVAAFVESCVRKYSRNW